MVDPSFAERQLIEYSEFLPQVKLVTSWATTITETEVSTAHGDQIPYDYLVVASGHIRTESDPVTRDESLLYYKEENDRIKSSSSILIIGGGPTGVEFAGEVADQFPDKKITVVHRGSRLLEFIGSKASQKAEEWLSSKKIDVIVGQSVHLKSASEGLYETSNGETIVADYFFDSTGRPLGTSWLQNTILKGSLDIQCRVAVEKNLLVKGYKNIFAVGDITNIPELKQGFAAMKHAQVVAKNLRTLLGGGSVDKLSAYKPGRAVAVISLGRKEGVAQVSCFTISGVLPGMYKSRDLFVGRTRKTYGLKPLSSDSCCAL
ncbi:hypothetical protein Cgig2_005462 [Carnegiea gigantea]|uniref:FAD/NAD(P)-binding domain-containing protein n=1 Tax=Carnegiea gigantea TaxID=171969 RepID=A0A9Q1QGK1_9CARY|nr:hypothetical protein Cgig2_005462 [Carnegiea gigantea]